MNLYQDRLCRGPSGRDPETHDADECLEVLDNGQFLEEMLFSCGGEVHPNEGAWPVPVMSLMAAAILFVCLFGQCQAQARGRRYRPRAAASERARQRLLQSDGMYPGNAGYGSTRSGGAPGVARGGGGGGGGGSSEEDGGGGEPADVEMVELTPVAKELVKEHEESGKEAPTMQQITQMVLRARSVKPSEKRQTMMLLFRHWGYAGGEKPKPPASDHPSQRRREQQEQEQEDESVDVEAGSQPAAAESLETESTPLLQGAE